MTWWDLTDVTGHRLGGPGQGDGGAIAPGGGAGPVSAGEGAEVLIDATALLGNDLDVLDDRLGQPG